MARANQNGRDGESVVSAILDDMGIRYEKQYPIGVTFWKKRKVDFFLPDKHITLEVKNQNASGSVDEKFPGLIWEIKAYHPYGCIIVLSGIAHNDKMIAWMKAQRDAAFIDVLKLTELREFLETFTYDLIY